MALDPYEELQLVHRMNLRNLHRAPNGFIFSCPICNEGTHPNRKRGTILGPRGARNYTVFLCHNCLPDGTSFRRFVELVDPILFEEYQRLEKAQFLQDLKDGKINKKQKTLDREPPQFSEVSFYKLNPDTFIQCTDYPPAFQYACYERKIPRNIISELMYCPKKTINGKPNPFYDMLIFPLYGEEIRGYPIDTHVHGFQGRSIRGEKRFYNFSKNESFKVHNLFRVDKTKDVYVFEAIIDSCGIPNSVSSLGSSMSERVKEMLPNRVWCLDNDDTGYKKSLKLVNEGERVLVWPEEIKAKDFNLLVKKGIKHQQLLHMIEDYTMSGLKARVTLEMKLNKKKR